MPAAQSASFDPTFLIAGFGSIGRRHFQNLQSLGYTKFVFLRTKLGTLPDAEIAQWPSVTNLDEALSHQPTVAIISNPSALHLNVALGAARAGCHLFIEKPLSNTLTGCEELQAIVRQNNLTTMVGCQFRFHPLLVTLRQAVLEGRLGSIVGASAEWGEHLPSWHPWEDHRKSYSARADLGGGVVLTLIHPLDYLHWFFGPCVKVSAALRGIDSLGTAVDEDWAEILLEFTQGNVVAQVHLDYLQRPAVHRLRVWGEQAAASLDFHAGQLQIRNQDGTDNNHSTEAGFERNTLFLDEMRHFLDCCAARRPTSIPLEEGIAVLKIALEARKQGERKQ